MSIYQVTVTPKVKVYAGSWENGSYTVEIAAKDRAAAIRRARADYAQEGNKGVPASFRAKLAKESRHD